MAYKIGNLAGTRGAATFTGHGPLDVVPDAAVNGDLYFDIDAGTWSVIAVSSGGGNEAT